ncbi:acyl carrier protein [Kitasatospora atroaurantiaca]|uniref:acyl carrier protein n=1 Tax=Kitasatospora atroaurantiaca TaxID=285545 RepID=UPI001FEA773F|nr:acyl carrier protein [Kitasatospora atroaurantiaca]
MHVSRPVQELDATVPFTEYGLDSVAALHLYGDIEDAFGFSLDPTLAWEYPTVAELAGFLATESAGSLTH